MKFKLIIFLISILLISGCMTTSFTTKEQEDMTTEEPENMSRFEAESKAFEFLYKHTSNKEVFDKELKAENYIHDSWKKEDVWYTIFFVGHTFIELRVYDDGSDKIKLLVKTDYGW